MKLHGFVGGGTGKLGNSVFSQNAGRTIVRQYNPEVKNPNTARQQNSRARFTLAGDIAKQFAQALAIGRPRVGALTSRNQFTKDIIPVSAGVINMVSEVLTPDYSKLPISKGGMPKINITGASLGVGLQGIEVTYDENYNPIAAGYVPPMEGKWGLVLVALNVKTGDCYIKQYADTSTGDGAIVVPTAVAGDKYHVYGFVKWIPASHNDVHTEEMPWRYPSDQSDVVYVGEITAA